MIVAVQVDDCPTRTEAGLHATLVAVLGEGLGLGVTASAVVWATLALWVVSPL
ncbi:MAG: hypothetical protein ACR2OB_05455 [Solirubrobacteraceae bacterium]